VFSKVLEVVVALAFVVMLFLVVAQVLIRYVLPFSVPWTEEAARYTLMFITFLGAAVALRKGDHICVSTLLERMSPRAQRAFYIAFVPVMLAFLSIILYGSSIMARQMWRSPVGSISWLRMGHLYVISFAGSLLMIVALFLWSKEVLHSARELPRCADRGGEQWNS
jgi:TRAP-type C4-dicarboxylate transport system permease small subunit